MGAWLRKLVHGTSITLIVSVVVVALMIGAFQLVARQLPSYQEEIRTWVAQELGIALDYAELDATLGWRGPELTFRNVSVRSVDDSMPFLTARAASVGFNTLDLLGALVTRDKVAVKRLTFDGTELTLVRADTGAYRLQGAPTSEARSTPSVDVPPAIDVLVLNSRVLYIDAARSVAWDFEDVAGSLRRDGNELKLEASAQPPRELAARVTIAVQAFVGEDDGASAEFTGDWRLSAEAAAVDIAVAAPLFPVSAVVPGAGHGDVTVRLDWQRGVLTSVTAGATLRDVALHSGEDGADARYERIDLSADWQRMVEGWQVALRDVAMTRNGRAWPMPATADIGMARDADGLERYSLRSSFVRLEDLAPFIAALPPSAAVERWRLLEPRGDVRDLDVAVWRTSDGRLDYSVAAAFASLGVASSDDLPGVTGLSGQLRADSRAGRLELASTSATLDWRAMFRDVLDIDALSGILVWRAGQDAVRIVSDDLVIATPDVALRSNLELGVPTDGSSPVLDLRSTLSGFDVAVARRYLPAHKMPATVVDWLDAALLSGRATGAEVAFVGPVRAFPFDGGEGEFRARVDVEDGELAFVADWPIAQDLDGTVEFFNARFAGRGSARLLGNRSDNLRVAFNDLRTGELSLTADTAGDLAEVLAFLNSAPLIAGYLGEDFARLEAPTGSAALSLDLFLPLRQREAYRLTAGLDIQGAELAYRGFEPHATEIAGSLALSDGVLRGTGIEGIFLDGPVTASVDSVSAPGYRARIDLEGEVTINAVVAAFELPYGDRLAGQATWKGRLLLPAPAGDGSAPTEFSVSSNLSGVALRFPEPFAKPPGVPTNVELKMTFPENGLTMAGNLGATRHFALDFDAVTGEDRPYRFRRAAVEFGGELAEFRTERGVTLDGRLPLLRIDDWMELSRSSSPAQSSGDWSGVLAGADLDIAEFAIFGQRLGSTQLTAQRRTNDWQFEIESDAIAGTVLVPSNLRTDPKVTADMRRVYLNSGDGSGSELDPRELPGLVLHADEFGVGQRRIGRLYADIAADPLGLRLVSFESATESFAAQGSGGWFMGVDGATTRFAVSLNSTNVAQMLAELGFDPFIDAEKAEVTASVYWPGAPSGAWLDHIGGDLALRAEKGSLIDVEPGGAGRAAGLLSISALPRRLALDFRDVFNRGLVFDEVTGEFVIVDGNAYTDNLKVTGPVAEVGIIGRTGLRDRDYSQQAIVTAEPGKVLPTVGALLGGPQVAAALLIFTRIFKKPLRGIGSASYCVTGSWQEPMVEKLTDEQVQKGALCAEMPSGAAVRAAAESER